MQISSKFTIGVHLLAVIDYLGEDEKVTSSVLAGSMCNWTSSRITRLRREKSGCSVSFWRSGKSMDQLRRGLS